MEPETIALLTALVVLATGVLGFMAKLKKDVSEIHVMVNSRMKEALERIDQLDEALRAAGIRSPDRPQRE